MKSNEMKLTAPLVSFLTFFAMVRTSFGRLNVSKLIQKANAIYTAMLNNDSFPAPQPGLDTLLSLTNTLKEVQTKVDNGDRSSISARNNAKKQLTTALKTIGIYVNFTANGSASLLATSGFELYKASQTVTLQPIDTIIAMSVPNTNSISISVVGAKGAKSFMYQYTTSADKEETSWTSVNHTTRKFAFTNLTKGTQVFVRVIAIGSKSQTQISETLSRYIQ